MFVVIKTAWSILRRAAGKRTAFSRKNMKIKNPSVFLSLKCTFLKTFSVEKLKLKLMFTLLSSEFSHLTSFLFQ